MSGQPGYSFSGKDSTIYVHKLRHRDVSQT